MFIPSWKQLQKSSKIFMSKKRFLYCSILVFKGFLQLFKQIFVKPESESTNKNPPNIRIKLNRSIHSRLFLQIIKGSSNNMLTPLSTMVFSSARIDALYRGYVFCHKRHAIREKHGTYGISEIDMNPRPMNFYSILHMGFPTMYLMCFTIYQKSFDTHLRECQGCDCANCLIQLSAIF